MAGKIISYEQCAAMGQCEECPQTKCPEHRDCAKCSEHCPCCAGPDEGFCDQCDKDCDNRNKEYDPDTIS